jgi:hypothetical protein
MDTRSKGGLYIPSDELIARFKVLLYDGIIYDLRMIFKGIYEDFTEMGF